MPPGQRFDEKEVFNLLCDGFDLEEFRELCFHLNVKYDDLQGEGLRAKIRELVQMFVRNGKLFQLVEAIQAAQPDLPLIPLNDEQHRDGQRTKQVFTLFISAHQPDRLSTFLSQIPVVSRFVEPSAHAARGALPVVTGNGGENGPGKLIMTTHDDGVSIATFEDPEALLRKAVAIPSVMKERGEPAPRLGLYSDTVSGDEMPAEAINLARRIMKLGDAGHILASRQVAEYFKNSAEFAGLFTTLGKYEVRPHVRVEVFNVTAPAKFGNPAPPKPKEHEQVLSKVVIPKQIRCSQAVTIRLTFDDNLSFVRVVFKYDNPNINITCPGQDGDDCAFEFDFIRNHDSHTQSFEIGAREIEKHSQAVVRIYCYDETGELLSPPVQGRINLVPRVAPPNNFYDVVRLVLWLWDGFTCFRPHVRVLVVLGALILSVVLLPFVLPAAWQVRFWKQTEALLIKYWWPQPNEGSWREEFLLTDDGELSTRNDWDFRRLTVKPTPIPPTDPEDPEFATIKDGALLVSGEGTATHKPFEPASAFYDFNLDFWFRLTKGNTARWIIRADPDADRWYEFEFTKENGGASIWGYVHTSNGRTTKLDGSGRPVVIDGCCHEGDEFRITAQVEGYEFRHCIYLETSNLTEEDTRDTFDRPIPAGVIADRRWFTFFRGNRYGNLGLRSEADGSEAMFLFWRVSPLNSSQFCKSVDAK